MKEFVLIVSDENDGTTNEVIEWLLYLKTPFIRINYTDEVEVVKIEINKFIIQVRNKLIDSDNIKSYWFRTGNIKLSHKWASRKNSSVENGLNARICNAVKIHEKYELADIVDHIHYILENKPNKIGSKLFSEVNKLMVLHQATLCGLTIPDTLITSQLDVARHYFNDQPTITKSIRMFTFREDVNILSYTEKIDLASLSLDGFQNSLLQKQIEKEYEIRAFYLKGKFYSMAIFSQSDSQTQVDFRRYIDERPNRFVPYILPNCIEIKIISLMEKLNLDTGSIDLIKTKDEKYYFLEVNPVGQFGMVSVPCNYYLEKLIATSLKA